MISDGNLLLETPDSRQTNFANDQSGLFTIGRKLKTPDKLIFSMIKGGAGVGDINDLIHCSEGDLSICLLPFMCDVKAAFFHIGITDIFKAIIAYYNIVIFFQIQCLKRSSSSHLAWKMQLFLGMYRKYIAIFYIFLF